MVIKGLFAKLDRGLSALKWGIGAIPLLILVFVPGGLATLALFWGAWQLVIQIPSTSNVNFSTDPRSSGFGLTPSMCGIALARQPERALLQSIAASFN